MHIPEDDNLPNSCVFSYWIATLGLNFSTWNWNKFWILVCILLKQNELLQIRSSLCWNGSHCGLEVRYQHFGTPCQSHLRGTSSPKNTESCSPRRKNVHLGLFFLDCLDCLTLEDGISRLSQSKTSVTNYQSVPLTIPKLQRSHLHCGRAVKS
jgi:hypothetical protein